MSKVYVLDTSVLLNDPTALQAFKDNTIVIPTVVLEELDSKKTNMDEIGRNARHFSRIVDELRNEGNLLDGVNLQNGGELAVLPTPKTSTVYEEYGTKTNDLSIIATAHRLKDKTARNVTLVSKDMLMRIRADAIGVQAEDYLNDKAIGEYEEHYKGYKEVYVDSSVISKFYKTKKIKLPEEVNAHENEFLILKDPVTNGSALAKHRNGELLRTSDKPEKEGVWGLHPRNAQQHMSLDLLQDPSIKVVTMMGKAGTGKTLLALASGLEQSNDDNLFEKMTVARPIVPMGKDIGYLPGEKEEKLRPWIQPIFDNLEFLLKPKQNGQWLEEMIKDLPVPLLVEALTYIRGRSIPDNLVIIDEAQNLTKHEVKTILTRIGEGSKVILTGDPEQIDHPFLDPYSNGLTHVAESFKDQSIAGHVYLTNSERSDLAEISADIL